MCCLLFVVGYVSVVLAGSAVFVLIAPRERRRDGAPRGDARAERGGMQRARSHQQLRSKHHHRSVSEPIDSYALEQLKRTASAFALPEQTRGLPRPSPRAPRPSPIITPRPSRHSSPEQRRPGQQQHEEEGVGSPQGKRSLREKPTRCRRELLSFVTPRLLFALLLLLCALALLCSAAAAAMLWWQLRRRLAAERVEAFALPGTHLTSSLDEPDSAPPPRSPFGRLRDAAGASKVT